MLEVGPPPARQGPTHPRPDHTRRPRPDGVLLRGQAEPVLEAGGTPPLAPPGMAAAETQGPSRGDREAAYLVGPGASSDSAMRSGNVWRFAALPCPPPHGVSVRAPQFISSAMTKSSSRCGTFCGPQLIFVCVYALGCLNPIVCME